MLVTIAIRPYSGCFRTNITVDILAFILTIVYFGYYLKGEVSARKPSFHNNTIRQI